MRYKTLQMMPLNSPQEALREVFLVGVVVELNLCSKIFSGSEEKVGMKSMKNENKKKYNKGLETEI